MPRFRPLPLTCIPLCDICTNFTFEIGDWPRAAGMSQW